MIGTSKITAKGQLTIPQDIREKKGLATGTAVVITETNDGVLIRKSDTVAKLFEQAQQWTKRTGIRQSEIKRLVRDEKKRTLKRV